MGGKSMGAEEDATSPDSRLLQKDWLGNREWQSNYKKQLEPTAGSGNTRL